MTDSPFNWRGKPSIFTKNDYKTVQEFNGVNSDRAARQTRVEPRPTYLVSDSVYLKSATPIRSFGKLKCPGK
jgi:hypothetical protein